MTRRHVMRRGGKIILRYAERFKDHGSRVNPYTRLPPDDMSETEDQMYTHKENRNTVRVTYQGADPNDDKGAQIVTFEDADGDGTSMPSHVFFAQFTEATGDDIADFEAAAPVGEDASALKTATDAELRSILAMYNGEKTGEGKPTMEGLNADIQAMGFLPITAAKRDELLA